MGFGSAWLLGRHTKLGKSQFSTVFLTFLTKTKSTPNGWTVEVHPLRAVSTSLEFPKTIFVTSVAFGSPRFFLHFTAAEKRSQECSKVFKA